MKGDTKGGGGWLRDGKEGLVLETGGAERERNRSVLWVIIGNRKSTRKRLVRGNKTEEEGLAYGERGRTEERKVETGRGRGIHGPMTVLRRHPDVHARTRCVISDCLSGFVGG